MSAVQFAIVAVTIGIASCLQSSVGFGLGTLSAPIIALIDPTLIPGTLLVIAGVITLGVALRERADLDLRGAGWAFTGRIPGTLVGAFLVTWLPPHLLALTVSGVVLIGVVISVGGWRPRTGPLALVGAGVASGVFGTATSIGGPPMALVWQHSPGPRLRGTMSAFFLAGSVLSLTALALAGALGRETITMSIALGPAALIGYLTSRYVNRRLNHGRLRRLALIVSAVGALLVIADQVF